MSLRARLLAASLLLVVIGLVVADVATYTALRSFLIHRVDQQLGAAQSSVERALFDPHGGVVGATLRQLGEVVPGVYVLIRDETGQTLAFAPGRPRDATPSAPKVPDKLGLPAAQAEGAGGGDSHSSHDQAQAAQVGRFLTTGSAEPRGPAYRVLASSWGQGGVVVVALPLSDTRATLGHLVLIEAFVTLAVVAVAGGLGLWLVRVGLRPLTDIESTAASITAGETATRVPRTDPGTEVGRLGGALNVMLDTLDRASAEQRASEEEARASEQRMRRFVADASHELRTPVAAVRAYAELYRMGADKRPADLARVLPRIELEAARMGVLVDDLLLLARLDEGRPLDHTIVDLGAVATDAVEAARALEPKRPIELGIDGSVEVLGDQGRLRQVIDNLLANVRSHTPAGSEASVFVAGVDGTAVLEVSDRGPGLDADQAAKVFQRFFRADPARARDHGGTGLGLAIVAAIAASHGGRATVASREGGGAIFRIELPLNTS